MEKNIFNITPNQNFSNSDITIHSGDLEVQNSSGNNILYVDSTTNRVGINQSNPTTDLDVNGDIKCNKITTSQAETFQDIVVNDRNVLINNNGASTDCGFLIYNGTKNTGIFYSVGTDEYYLADGDGSQNKSTTYKNLFVNNLYANELSGINTTGDQPNISSLGAQTADLNMNGHSINYVNTIGNTSAINFSNNINMLNYSIDNINALSGNSTDITCNNNINMNNNNITNSNNIICSNLDCSSTNLTTDSISEGTSNLYYLDSRVMSFLNSGTFTTDILMNSHNIENLNSITGSSNTNIIKMNTNNSISITTGGEEFKFQNDGSGNNQLVFVNPSQATPTNYFSLGCNNYDTFFIKRDGNVKFMIDGTKSQITSSPLDMNNNNIINSGTIYFDGATGETGYIATDSSTTLFLGNSYDGTRFQILKGGNIKISGDIDMLTTGIINMKDPTNPQDATTKSYVDSLSLTNIKRNMVFTNSSNITLNSTTTSQQTDQVFDYKATPANYYWKLSGCTFYISNKSASFSGVNVNYNTDATNIYTATNISANTTSEYIRNSNSDTSTSDFNWTDTHITFQLVNTSDSCTISNIHLYMDLILI